VSLTDEELRRPLRPRRRLAGLLALKVRPVTWVSSLVIVLAIAGVTYVIRSGDPLDGEPVVRMNVPPMEQAPAPPTPPAPPVEEAEEAPPAPDEMELAEDPGSVEGGPDMADSLVVAPAPGMTEKGPTGPLPRIASDGRAPSAVYARPVDKALLETDKPKIALVLGGMGLNDSLTRRAIGLPGEITLAFAPYGKNAKDLAAAARADGHELMLQLPMEPFGYPAADPGPRTLRAGEAASSNIDDLMWHLSRFPGYFGIINYLGASFLADKAAAGPVFAEAATRGLFWLDDGSVARSSALTLGPQLGLTVRQASINVDARNRDEVKARLAELEARALEGGIAVGTGTGLDVTMDAVERWAEGLADRGFLLVPVSAAYRFEPAVGTTPPE
jgi:uncharacterized protein